MKLGDTFWDKHLYVVCSEPSADGAVVIFNVTTRRSWSDTSCIIQPGEHPSIVHESVVGYQYGELMPADTQAKFETISVLRQARREPVSRKLLRRIQLGALRSDHTAQEQQELVQKSLVPENNGE